MTSDAQDDDRTPARPAAEPQPTGLQHTGSQPGPGAASPPADKTLVVGGPEMGGHLPVGTRLAEFEITALIGEGGFGVVYLAHDHSLQRRVALKEYMPASLATRAGGTLVQVRSERHRETFEMGLRSFVNEAQLLARFDHPALVKVFRFWEGNGTAYMVMPFLEGQTLKDVLKGLGRRPDEAWLRAVLGPLTEALLVIHAEHCFHRDIAPDNVMLLPGTQRWLLLDFGAARRVIGDMTQALTVILKPGYAPVEQYAEIPGMRQGPWTDVYALAAVVYFAITGRTPPPSVGRLLHDSYAPLAQAAAGRYSPEFLAAIDRALAVRPEARTQSIGDFRRDLGLDIAADVGPGRSPARAIERVTATPSLSPSTAPSIAAAPAAAAPATAPAAAPAAKQKGPGLALAAGAAGIVVVAVVAYLALAPKPAPAPVTAAAVPAPAPAPVPAVEAAAAVPAAWEPKTEFERTLQARSPGFDLRLDTNAQRYRIGRDHLGMTVHAERDGFLYLYAYGADKSLVLLYPNANTGPVKVARGQALRLPLAGEAAFETTAPAGPTELLALLSPSERDLGALQPEALGSIRLFPTGHKAAALAAKFEGRGPVLAGKPLCAAAPPCDAAFGAALVRVEVVP